MSKHLWDYDEKVLKKSKKGRLLLLERMINYGTGDKKLKISLEKVKENWNSLHLFRLQKKLFELLIWGKYKSSPGNRKSFWMN
jgi:hypothetical protein